MDMTPLEKLGLSVRRASDEEAATETILHDAKEQALAKWNRRSGITKPRVALVVAFAVFIAAAIFLRVSGKDKPITYAVGPGDSPSALGVWIAAGSNAVPLRFSEGTQVTLEPGARARVTDTNAHGATMLVERGHAHAKVVHVEQTTSWLLHAGPFDVNVVGTEFDVSWDPTHEVFDLRVSEGKVIVRGPLLHDGRAVSASESLRVDVHHQSSETRTESATNPTPVKGTPDVHVPTTEDGQTKAENAPPLPVVSSEKPLTIPLWQKLAAAGKHKEALDAAEQAGFDHILDTASIPVLLELADEARYAGSVTRAREALIRARVMGAKGRTAFMLGKLAADHEHAPAVALSWFLRYLDESPSGGLAEQALGRIVELHHHLGHRDDAAKAAQSYLQRYPGGAYETLARRVVDP